MNEAPASAGASFFRDERCYAPTLKLMLPRVVDVDPL